MPARRPGRLCRPSRFNPVAGSCQRLVHRGSRVRHIGIALVHVYRWTVSPLLGNRCKYHPSCSQYALDALREFGLVKGSILAGWRLLRCNPWSHGGVDHAKDQELFA
jgi:putative membrane protein insertion efficiency factor